MWSLKTPVERGPLRRLRFRSSPLWRALCRGIGVSQWNWRYQGVHLLVWHERAWRVVVWLPRDGDHHQLWKLVFVTRLEDGSGGNRMKSGDRRMEISHSHFRVVIACTTMKDSPRRQRQPQPARAPQRWHAMVSTFRHSTSSISLDALTS